LEVIRHNGVCSNINAKNLRLIEYEFFDPALAVLDNFSADANG